MSRFSADIGVCDMQMWQDIDTVNQLCGFFAVSVVLVAVQSRGMLALPGLLVVVFYALLQVADRSTREVKRLSNNAAAPVLSTVNEMKQGAPIVRALGSRPSWRAAAARRSRAVVRPLLPPQGAQRLGGAGRPPRLVLPHARRDLLLHRRRAPRPRRLHRRARPDVRGPGAILRQHHRLALRADAPVDDGLRAAARVP